MRLPNIPDDVWAGRPWLKHVRTEAHRRGVGADVALWSALVSVAANMPVRVRIETGIGTSIRPSLFVAAAGRSGHGKSNGWALGRALVPHLPEPSALSTGEGLVEAYFDKRPRFERHPQLDDQGMQKLDDKGEPLPDKVKQVWTRVQVRHNMVGLIDEGEGLYKQLQRPGNILGATLRAMWSGATTGQTNADAERKRQLDAGTYNLGLFVGMQPDIAGQLLNDVGTGMAQRFLWVAVVDGHMGNDWPGFIRAAPVQPLPWTSPLPPEPEPTVDQFMAQLSGGVMPEVEPVVMHLDHEIADGLFADQVARARGDRVDDERDSQRPAMHVKISGVLAWLDSRLHITADDWALAGALLDTSDAVRAALLDHADEVTARERTERGIERAQVSAAEADTEVRRGKVRERLVELLAENDSLSRSDLRKAFSSATRAIVADVLVAEVARGTLVETPTPSGGVRYALAGPK